eukprot:CAMPEP_0195593650 /NCGR_PEP_ID=MMETSP0815-20121206/999_1 /TAXON_ID=97485 /ORGANISM="Prymnesium parvum, Strain Texoma1" /LENGTH=269 /DNA_ID=CAMNT_0040732807 /DNA_START=121 /DNA_END=930 /DNA_ORIENTATION=-
MSVKNDELEFSLEDLCTLMTNTWPPRDMPVEEAPENSESTPDRVTIDHLVECVSNTELPKALDNSAEDCLLSGGYDSAAPSLRCSRSELEQSFLGSKAQGEKNVVSDGRKGQLPLDVEVHKVLLMCQQALSALVDPTHKVHSEALAKAQKLGPRLRGTYNRSTACRSNLRFSLTSQSRNVLKQWVDQHLDHPYPSPLEKNVLARAANISLKQVNDWFTNFRKRHWNTESELPEVWLRETNTMMIEDSEPFENPRLFQTEADTWGMELAQ